MGESNSAVQRPSRSAAPASETVAKSKANMPMKRIFTRSPLKQSCSRRTSASLALQHPVDFQPQHELREPARAGPVRVAEAEAMPTVLVEMKLHGPARVL